MTNPYAFLERYAQWCPTSVLPDPERPGKLKKVTLNRQGQHTDAHDPANWMTRDEARLLSTHHSFVLSRVPGSQTCLFFLDVDNCINPDGSCTQIVHDLRAMLGPNVLAEVSVSGKGMHFWGWGVVPLEHAKKNTALGLEFYTDKRHGVIGTYWFGSMDLPCEGVAAVVHRFFPPRTNNAAVAEDGPPRLPDEDVVRRMLASQGSTSAIFGGGVHLRHLWERDLGALRQRWPADNEDGFDRSSADAALASHLAFWTGRNAAQMRRLMLQSGLRRDKYDREDYLDRTIANACAMCTTVLQDKPSGALERMQEVRGVVAPAAPAPAAPAQGVYQPQPRTIEGTNFADRETQIQLFAGCCYVLDQHKVLLPNGLMVDPGKFRAHFGGNTFSLGGPKQKVTSNAWEAFTENQEIAFPRAESTCFRPDLPFGTIVTEGALRRVNTFLPPNVRMVEGDPTPLLDHLRRLLPVGDDALIFLSYLAACVQYPGRKFAWAPVLQGVEGNGKTLFSIAAAYAVGKRYVHWPKASKLTKQFNGWMVGKLLYCVEDIYMPGVQGDAVMEELKPMITGGRGLEIESKGVDQISADIVGNFIINTNHKDGVRKSAKDRRYCMLYCAQQDEADLARDFGSDVSGYMNRMYGWLDDEDGLAIFAHYLKHFEIPERFNPAAGAQRAPRSSSHDEAVAAGLGMIEQLVLEAIEEEKPGFRGGWVSSTALKTLLMDSGRDRNLSPNRRKEIMRSLGYVPHPSLPRGGRTTNPVLPDGNAPVLFVRPGSPQAVDAAPALVAKAYTAAQTSS